jgi:hypothetical protein
MLRMCIQEAVEGPVSGMIWLAVRDWFGEVSRKCRGGLEHAWGKPAQSLQLPVERVPALTGAARVTNSCSIDHNM